MRSRHLDTIRKSDFASLMRCLLEEERGITAENIKAGFAATGICPYDPTRVLKSANVAMGNALFLGEDDSEEEREENNSAVSTSTATVTRKFCAFNMIMAGDREENPAGMGKIYTGNQVTRMAGANSWGIPTGKGNFLCTP